MSSNHSFSVLLHLNLNPFLAIDEFCNSLPISPDYPQNPQTPLQRLLCSVSSVTAKPLEGVLQKVTCTAFTLVQEKAEHLSASVRNRTEITGFNPGVLPATAI